MLQLVRIRVLLFLCFLAMITYLDRACFQAASSEMKSELGITTEQYGWLQFAFSLAYALFEIPGGWLGDRFGPRKTLMRIVLWWSIFTVLTGLVYPIAGWTNSAFHLLFLIRFLFGMGEAGAFPNITRALQNWFPLKERGRAQGAIWFCARFLGGLAPFLFEAVMALFASTHVDGTVTKNWRPPFWLFGGIGVAWGVVCWFWFRDKPEEKASVSGKELEEILAGRRIESHGRLDFSWVKMIKCVNLWALCLMYFCISYSWYFNIQWLSPYLKENMINDQTWGWVKYSLLAGAPLLLGSLGCVLGGWLSDWLFRRTGSRRWSRRLCGLLGLGLSTLFCLCTLFFNDPVIVVGLMTLASFGNDLTLSSCWAVCQDIGGKRAGVVSGAMNMIGNLGGATTAAMSPVILRWGSWPMLFLSFAMVWGIGWLLWWRIDAEESLEM